MKLLLVGLIVVVVTGGIAARQSTPVALKHIVYGPNTRINADTIRYNEGQKTAYARGSVRIVSESTTITADEADLHLLRSTSDAVDLDVVLRGQVRVVITPLNGGRR
jgi:lipopolysaccharide assembly outer membrane protein LptD (OstA)